ncbi:MAG: glycosyltransferase family 2 protein [Gammaproteobacteria bacterium]|nr:glycosyltransferase family 2 protein [Gammaproteobacteria bacterium]
MKLSIIVVNYRAFAHIAKALDALRPGFPDDWEVIIVDNESEPRAFAEFAGRYPWVRMIANPANSGFGFGCVIGVREATGEQLLFMNPDVVATVADIRALIVVKEAQPNVAIISPKQVGTDGKPQKVFDEFPDFVNQSKTLKALRRAVAPGRKPDPRANHHGLVRCDWITGSFLLVARSDYDRIGGWSSDYWMYVEDADLCKRARDLGLEVAYTPDVQVIHAHGGSSRINIDVKSMTKLEVIISKHVYVQKHFAGISRPATHGFIALLRLPGLGVAALADLLTLRSVPALRVRSRMLAGLLTYYADVRRSGSWLSPRAIANQS